MTVAFSWVARLLLESSHFDASLLGINANFSLKNRCCCLELRNILQIFKAILHTRPIWHLEMSLVLFFESIATKPLQFKSSVYLSVSLYYFTSSTNSFSITRTHTHWQTCAILPSASTHQHTPTLSFYTRLSTTVLHPRYLKNGCGGTPAPRVPTTWVRVLASIMQKRMKTLLKCYFREFLDLTPK